MNGRRNTGRLIVCTRCQGTVDVLEAAQGATTDLEQAGETVRVAA